MLHRYLPSVFIDFAESNCVTEDSKHATGLRRLIEQIKRLEEEKANLTSQLLTAQGDAEAARHEGQDEVKQLQMDRDRLEKENHELQEAVVTIRTNTNGEVVS